MHKKKTDNLFLTITFYIFLLIRQYVYDKKNTLFHLLPYDFLQHLSYNVYIYISVLNLQMLNRTFRSNKKNNKPPTFRLRFPIRTI